MGYVVAHVRKIKTTAGLRNVAEHNSRTKIYDSTGGLIGKPPPWIQHYQRSTYNTGDHHRPDVVLKRWRERIQNAGLARKPQKNAAAGIEFNISASPGSFENVRQWKKYFDDVSEFLTKRYGEQNVIQTVTHYDEKTPHMHLIMTPIIFRDGKARYSSSQFMGGREGLRALQSDLAEKVGKKHGLERGLEGSTARHTDQAEFAAVLNSKKEELKQDYLKMAAERESFEQQRDGWMNVVGMMNNMERFKTATYLSKHLSGLTQNEQKECWKSFETRAQEIRSQRHEKGPRINENRKDDNSYGR